MSGLLTEEWPAEAFEALLSRADRVVVLFHAEANAALREFEDAAPESAIVCVRAHLRSAADPRWAAHRIEVAPTLAYFEKGEELERLEGEPGFGLRRRDIDAFLEHVEGLTEDDVPRWLKRRRQPTSRRL